MASSNTAARRTSTGGRALRVFLVLLTLAALTWHDAAAGFTAPTANAANKLVAGRVALTESSGTGAAAFSAVTGMKPGSLETRCVLVTYTGNLAASIKLYAASYTDSDLGAATSFTVETGSGTTCAAFGTASTAFTGSIRTFATTKTNWATGVGTFTPAVAATAKPYRLSIRVLGDNAAVSDSISLNLVWEANNT
ncbi:MAG TPA: hypothetical protein VES42_27780 [Pilimelia sp.]|nr:hypothetical protein [Pilimelia sp.]